MRSILLTSFILALGLGILFVNFDSLVLKALEKNPQKLSKILEDYYKAQKIEQEKEQIRILAKQPIRVNTDNAPSKGAVNAKYKLIVFTDYQCPYCEKVEKVLDELMRRKTGDIEIFYKHLPLAFHNEAKPAAKAAWAAGQQGKFHEYSQQLFMNQRILGEDLYIKIANELGLNIQKFKLDKSSSKVIEEINKDIESAHELGFTGTPVVVLNGIPIKGAYPVEYFEMVMEVINEKQ